MGGYLKGMMTGVVVGTAIGIMMDPTRSNRDTMSMKKKASKIFKTAGNIIESLTDF